MVNIRRERKFIKTWEKNPNVVKNVVFSLESFCNHYKDVKEIVHLACKVTFMKQNF